MHGIRVWKWQTSRVGVGGEMATVRDYITLRRYAA